MLPFTGLDKPNGVAVDSAGNVYVTDGVEIGRVLKLSAGSGTQTVLPFTGSAGLTQAYGLAVEAAGNVYVPDYLHRRVLKLAAGSSTPTALPFTDLNWPTNVAVDAAGNVYLTGSLKDTQPYNKQVLKLRVQ